MPRMALLACAMGAGFLFAPAFADETVLSGPPAPSSSSPSPATASPLRPTLPHSTAGSPPLTLEDALSRTLLHNPALAAFAREIDARKGETRQAGLAPNPELTVELENAAGSGEFSGTDAAETTLRISQRIELGGKRTLRREVGGTEETLAEREAQRARAEVLFTTRGRFVSLLAAQERWRLAEEQLELARRTLEAVRQRVASGKAAALEEIRFGALKAEAELRSGQAGLELDAARNSLATSWGDAGANFGEALGELEALPPLPLRDEMEALADTSPQILIGVAGVERSRKSLALERARSFPDLTVDLGVRRLEEPGDNALVAGLTLPLPLFDRNQGARQAAAARLAKARDEERSARVETRAALAEAWQTLQAARLEADTLRESLLPAAQNNFEAVTYGYRAGKFGYLDMLDAQKSFFETRARYINALAACHRASADLERLLGQTLPAAGAAATAMELKRGLS